MVDFSTFASSSITSESLKCFVCKNYLSYFPISLCSNNKSICGRCTTPEGLISFENETFEDIFQHLKFPCRFKDEGCPNEFLPKQTPEHETNCPFRVVECIIDKPEKCQWQGSLSDLLRHCEKQHSDLICENLEFKIDTNDAEERDNLVLLEEDVLLVFRRKYTRKNKKLKFGCSFFQFGTSFKSHFCQLSVKNDKTTVMFDFEATERVLQVNDLSLEPLCSSDEPDTFLVKIILPQSRPVTSVQHSEINSELLRFLKCGQCKRIAKPPVFHCTSNMNVVCLLCEGIDQEYCSVCHRAPFSRANLDAILRFVQYPCKYQKEGCTMSLKYDTMEDHEVYCEYQPILCPFSYSEEPCSWWKLKKDLSSHIVEAHEDRIKSFEEIYEMSLKKLNTTPMRWSRHLFFLLCRFEDEGERCVWSLQKIGNFDTKYKFEVEIVNEALGLKIVMGTQCSIFTGIHHDIFRDDNSCYIQKNQIKCWKDEVNKILIFKVRILKM